MASPPNVAALLQAGPILLVPTTEVLLTSRDTESNALYADLAGSEEFLGSHVLRLPAGGVNISGNDSPNMRESRGKAKQFTTVNGRTVVVKDSFIYSNKGFKSLNQAQLLNDVLWYPDNLDAQQWLIYFISKPLLGSVTAIPIIPAIVPIWPRIAPERRISLPSSAMAPRKKDVKSFNDLLNHFPMIARQMQPGLERLFKEFARVFEKPLPPTPLQINKGGSRQESPNSDSLGSARQQPETYGTPPAANGFIGPLDGTLLLNEEDEDVMRRALETAVTAAIDLFQLVDKQQLSLLGSTTDLTGPMVERLIERYITEQVHDTVLFPRLCAIKRSEDLDLDAKIRQMENIDISQVGIPIQNERHGKQQLMKRLGRGIEELRKLGIAGSPQEMVEILLATEKTITKVDDDNWDSKPNGDFSSATTSEKPSSVLTINADTLVSLLLIVVIRSQVRHLQARLSYMRHFIFIDDVEAGEVGYALSTLEAVLSYLARDSAALRRASRTNKRLWHAIKTGKIGDVRDIMEPEREFLVGGYLMQEPEMIADSPEGAIGDRGPVPDENKSKITNGVIISGHSSGGRSELDTAESSTLDHVFPFQIRRRSVDMDGDSFQAARGKKVSMDTRSLSISSTVSFPSRTTTIDSRGSGIEGDTSVERLSQTQDPSGGSILMMAVESGQTEILKYLLSLDRYFRLEAILEDANNEGTTLLSAAVQMGNAEVVETILDAVLRVEDDHAVKLYLEQKDNMGRTVGHYLFDMPNLISRIGRLVPWRAKDRNGQTPLFALCRSYDHPDYREMVRDGLAAATKAQPDGLPLHLDDHIDGKGNTLLHIVNDPQLALYLLMHCDSDVNAMNDRRFTSLMVASKYGRVDMVRVLFADPRVDLYAKELRGLTAVELAKDDEVRNKIDDLILFSNPPADDGRITAVVRSFFVEDATIRLVIKSGAPSSSSTITVTTCRRSLTDFENLAKWLSVEHPASWLPQLSDFRSPFQIPSKPSRAVLRDIQMRLDNFLKILLAHSTFSTHEMLWEFFLVPDIQPEMMAERSKRKAETRVENVKDEYAPIEDVKDVEVFVAHAREMVRGVNHSTKSVIRRANKLKAIATDLYDAQGLCKNALSTLPFLSESHIQAFTRLSTAFNPTESSPHAMFVADLQAISSTIAAILGALSRPHALVISMSQTSKAVDRHLSSLRRSDRWPLGLLDDTRNKIHQEAAEKVEKTREELAGLGSELRYTQQTVAGELAAWQDLHERMGRRAVKALAARVVVAEKARLEAMKRAIRGVVDLKEHRQGGVASR
ncbi:hypothetical protein FGG08_002891 [Glutinoglossum americanum]|uniref:VPS9 domain-containing protein n=1 Tax=Glutinoglossum americanum TaxID=1670608 RepID=A0A9P8L445_9PEZI|nr:hypothetical protein FGG08_002891 [Glutinoglossum americanum]